MNNEAMKYMNETNIVNKDIVEPRKDAQIVNTNISRRIHVNTIKHDVHDNTNVFTVIKTYFYTLLKTKNR
jgi:hypothetical protein